eukprot:Nitzschia sp. Nitz4//scaffold88_size82704//29398//30540//NITZ4_005288-RA/size82704-processed-gene-0.49-mRNA-1//1//CDS//3329559482//4499//frame0
MLPRILRTVGSRQRPSRCCQSTQAFSGRISDLRSDTVTKPTEEMLAVGMNAPVGDDVMGEDPSVLELQEYMAGLFGKEEGLYVPTGTMSNLVALLGHCHTRASEIIIGRQSHLCEYEGGNLSGLGGIHTIQIQEDEDARMTEDAVRGAVRECEDVHWPDSKVLCLENTHNNCGGVALPPSYINDMAELAHEMNLKCHIDGARIFNSIVAQGVAPKEMCAKVDSISVCLSKGLGAPLGSVLLGDSELIGLARRARKRCGGGMRQAGVVAAMGLYGVKNNVERLQEDHARAQRIGSELRANGILVARNGQVDSNIVYFSLPENSMVPKEELAQRCLEEYGVNFGGAYYRGGTTFRMVTHLGVNDEDVDRAIESVINLTTRGH